LAKADPAPAAQPLVSRLFKKTVLSMFFAKSPEASGPFSQIMDDLLFGVFQLGQHPGGRFPGNAAVRIQVPHRVTEFLEFAENLGEQLCPGEGQELVFYVFIFDIHPKPEGFGHVEFHSRTPVKIRRTLAKISDVNRNLALVPRGA
jgi:hypothetical protein